MGKASGQPSPEIQQGMLSNQSALVKIAQGQAEQGTQLFQTSFPGFQSAEDFYRSISSGDPYAISRAIAPATQEITKQADAAKANILQNSAPGGQKNLALEMVDVNRGAQAGDLASNAYLQSFPALAQLAGQGISQGIQSAGTGISGYGTANQGLGELGQLQFQQQQLRSQQKGQMFGGLESMLGAGAELGSAAILAP